MLGFVPFAHFEHLVDKYQANRWTRDFTAWSHFICMAYAQLTRREGLRDLIACLNSQKSKLYHVGLRHRMTRSTLADANERRSSELFESLAQRLIELAIALHKEHDIGLGLKEPLYAMDSTTIDLCLKLFPWANFRSTKAAVKAHTVIDLRGAIPVMLTITTGKVHDVKALDSLRLPPGSIVVLDRGYVDFARLYALVQRQCSFVVRGKDNLKFATKGCHPFDPSTGIRADQTDPVADPQVQESLPWSTEKGRILRRENATRSGVLEQSVGPARADYCCHLQATLADRIVLQMAQAKLDGQALLWQLAQCGEVSNLDCCLRLSDRFDSSQRTRHGHFAAQLPASCGGQYVRKNNAQADGHQRPPQRRGRGASVAKRTVLKSASKFTGH